MRETQPRRYPCLLDWFEVMDAGKRAHPLAACFLGHFERQDDLAFGHNLSRRHVQCHDPPGAGRGNVECHLAGFENDQVVFPFDHVARQDQNVIDDHLAAATIATGIPALGKFRDTDFDDSAHGGQALP